MRIRNNLSDKQKQEIDVFVLRRKRYHITLPIIADWSGYHPKYLYAVERYEYPMNDKTRKAYNSVIRVFQKKHKNKVVYEKRQ